MFKEAPARAGAQAEMSCAWGHFMQDRVSELRRTQKAKFPEFLFHAPDLANNLATPALSEARQKRETSPRFPRPTAKDGSVVGAGFVARTILPAGNRNREERSCT